MATVSKLKLGLNGLKISNTNPSINRFFSVTTGSKTQLDLPEKPKKPPGSAYALYVKDKYNEVSRRESVSRSPDVMKIIATMWTGLNQQQKQEYERVRDLEKTKYKESMERFMQSLSEDQLEQMTQSEQKERAERERKRNKKLSKAFGKPERPLLSGYAIFVSRTAKGEQINSLDAAQQFVKVQGQKWKNMADAEKKPYLDEAHKNKLAYDPLLEAWERVMIGQGKSKLARATIKAKVAGEARKSGDAVKTKKKTKVAKVKKA